MTDDSTKVEGVPIETPSDSESEPQVFAVSRQNQDTQFNRRDFLTLAAAATVGLAVASEADPITAQASTVIEEGEGRDPSLLQSGCTVTTRSKTAKVNMRNGPGTGFAVLGQMDPNKEYPVTGKAKDTRKATWYRIEAEGIGQAWVAGAFVRPKGACAAVPTVDAPTSPGAGVEGTVEPGKTGINYTVGGKTYTLPCGSPIPAGAVCVCNCITVPAAPVCGCHGHNPGSCSCDQVCTCNTIHYWYPN